MGSLEEQLRGWVTAGVIDAPTAGRIRAFERGRPADQQGPTLVEAIAYLGVLVAALGAAILVANNWEDLPGPARVAVVGGAGVLAVLASEAFRRLARPAMERAGQMALLAGGILLASAAAVLMSSAGGTAEDATLALGFAGLPLALASWARSREHPQVVGVGLGIWAFGLSWLPQFDDTTELAWFTIAVLGLVALVVAEAGLFRPRASARAMAGLSIGAGAFFGSLPGGPVEIVPFVAGGLLVAASLLRRTFVYIVAGIATLFAALVRAIVRHIDDPTLAAIALMAIGVLLVVVVLALARVRPWLGKAAPA